MNGWTLSPVRRGEHVRECGACSVKRFEAAGLYRGVVGGNLSVAVRSSLDPSYETASVILLATEIPGVSMSGRLHALHRSSAIDPSLFGGERSFWRFYTIVATAVLPVSLQCSAANHAESPRRAQIASRPALFELPRRRDTVPQEFLTSCHDLIFSI